MIDYDACEATYSSYNHFLYSGTYQSFSYTTTDIYSVDMKGNTAVVQTGTVTDIYTYDTGSDTWSLSHTLAYGNPIEWAAVEYPFNSARLSDDGLTLVLGNTNHQSDTHKKGGMRVYRYNTGTLAWDLTLNYAANGAKKFGQAVAVSYNGEAVSGCAYGGNDGTGTSGKIGRAHV